MDNGEKASALNRIITGIVYLNINGTIYRLSQPTKEQRALAHLVYQETLDDSKFNNLLTRDQAKHTLHKKKVWTPENDKQYEGLLDHLDNTKADLYRALYKGSQQPSIRRKIKSIQTGLEKSLAKKYSLDYMTLENHAETARDEFLTAICITDEFHNPFYSYKDYNKKDNYILQRFLNFMMQNMISVENYREIARTEPFRGLWSIGQANVFNVPACDLSLNQKSLIMYSRMYDNVYEHPERPSDEVIKDDDMLDGWFVLERKEAERDRKRKEIENVVGGKGANRHGDAGEVFVMAESREEAQKIRELNDLNTKMKLKQRKAALEAGGRLEEKDLPDVKLELRNQAMRDMANRGK